MSGQLEHQFILRLPPDHADRVREAMKSDALEDRLQVEFLRDMRNARVKFDDEVLSGRVVDLPCIIESHKTLDKKTVYKTGDISQMLVCSRDPLDTPVENVEELPHSQRKEYLKRFTTNHGIAPPLKNVKRRRFRKTATKKFIDSPEVEKEVQRLLREDLHALKVSYKVVIDEDKDTHSVMSEGASRSQTPAAAHDEDSFLSYSSPASGQVEDKSELLRMLEEASCSSSSDDEDEEIAVDDNSGDGTAQSEEVLLLRSAVQDLENQEEEQRLKIQNTTNPMLRERFESFLEELQKQRKTKMEELRRRLLQS